MDDRDAAEAELARGAYRVLEDFGTGARGAGELAMLLDQPFEGKVGYALAATGTSDPAVAYIQRRRVTNFAMTDAALATYRTHVSRRLPAR